MIAIALPSDLTDQRVTEHIDFRCPTVFDPVSLSRGWDLVGS
jgi:hypothetical protein